MNITTKLPNAFESYLAEDQHGEVTSMQYGYDDENVYEKCGDVISSASITPEQNSELRYLAHNEGLKAALIFGQASGS